MSRPPRRTRQRSSERAVLDRLAHAGAPEHHRLGHDQARIVRQIDLDRAGEPRAVEQDRLLRQPGERRAGRHRQLRLHSGLRPQRPIDLLGRRGGDDEPRLRLDRDIDREAIAARHSARGVDDHRLEFLARRARTAHPQRAVLMHARAARDAVRRPHRQRDLSDGAIGREGRRRAIRNQGARHHPGPFHRHGRALSGMTEIDYSASARRSAASSRSARLDE